MLSFLVIGSVRMNHLEFAQQTVDDEKTVNSDHVNPNGLSRVKVCEHERKHREGENEDCEDYAVGTHRAFPSLKNTKKLS